MTHAFRTQVTNHVILEKNKVRDISASDNEDKECRELNDLIERDVDLSTFNREFKHIIDFYESNRASIEIVYRSRLEKIDFISVPHFSQLEKVRKNEFNQNVDRSSHKIKVNTLITVAPTLFKMTKIVYRAKNIMNYVPIIGACYNNADLIKDMTFYLVLFINLLVFITYKHRDGQFDNSNTASGFQMEGRIELIINRFDECYREACNNHHFLLWGFDLDDCYKETSRKH